MPYFLLSEINLQRASADTSLHLTLLIPGGTTQTNAITQKAILPMMKLTSQPADPSLKI
jgi:hypothetical protein